MAERPSDPNTGTSWVSAVAMIVLGLVAIVATIFYQAVAWLLVLIGGIGMVVVLVGIFNGSSASDLAGAWAGAGILFAVFAIGAALIALMMWKMKVTIWQTIPWIP